MEDPHTPTLPHHHEIKINVITPNSMNACRTNAGIWNGYFTPTKRIQMGSPGLSPIITKNRNTRINTLSSRIMSPCSTKSPLKKVSMTSTPISTNMTVGSNLTPSSYLVARSFNECNSSNNTFSELSMWDDSNILNKTLSVTLILKLLGMEIYSECFANAGIDVAHFMKLKQQDMLQLGIPSDDDCKRIEELLEDLNGKI